MLSSDIWFTVIISTLLIMLLVAVVVITIFLANRRNTKQEVKITQMQLDYEKELRTTEQEVQEQVLVNVGMDLHDNIGQLLRVTHMQLDQQMITDPENAAKLRPMRDTLTQAIDEVRRVGRSINSDLLDANGLIDTLQYEVDRLQQLNKYNIHWKNDGTEPRLSKDQKVIAFRIFQETINNILKHSGAANISISLSGENNFKLEVADDGKGFNKDEMMLSSKGSGLKNMTKRAELAKLKCTISTATGKGTTFILEQIV